MEIEMKAWLYDVLNAIGEIEAFINNMPDLPAYQSDLKTRRAVERNLEIIGEAVNRIVQKNQSVRLTGARKIVDTRNRIIHGYDTVSDEIIWTIITVHLPVLKQEAERLLQE
jgi:uncharacterized protein with HEPN domain